MKLSAFVMVQAAAGWFTTRRTISRRPSTGTANHSGRLAAS